MKDKKSNDIWVFVEIKEDGSVQPSSLELLNPGMQIAEKTKGKLVAVLFGSELQSAVKETAEYGADQILMVQGSEYEEYSTDIYTDALCILLKKYAPAALLIAATNNGRDMSPRIACRLKTGLTADCTGVDAEEDSGCLLWTRPTLGGNLMACIVCQEHWPQMGTIRPGTYKKKKIVKEHVEVRREFVKLGASRNRVRVYETIEEEGVPADLESAEIIVAGGKGLGSAQGFQMLQNLADALGGAVGATRGAVEEGWISHAFQIGQTGKTVSPKLYIACGISGAIQHMVGMSSANMIIAINQDREAPIFQIADYGIVGDIYKIIPEFTKKIVDLV